MLDTPVRRDWLKKYRKRKPRFFYYRHPADRPALWDRFNLRSLISSAKNRLRLSRVEFLNLRVPFKLKKTAVAALTLGAALFAALGYFGLPVLAASLRITGQALGANTGAYLDFTNTYNANVRVSWQTGNFSGYAWSEDLGWVDFGNTDNPAGPVTVNTSTGAVGGKAYVLNTGAYIDFTATYFSNVVINPATGIFTGWGWSEDVGWLDFTNTGVSIVGFTTDVTEPVTNASNTAMQTASSGGFGVAEGDWTKSQTGYFTWNAGVDNGGGSGIKGYCLYLGTDANADPGNSVTQTGTSGLLDTGNSPVSTAGTDCMFIVSGTTLDLGAGSYLSSPLVTGTYYLHIKAIDNGNNTYNAGRETFTFGYDDTAPTNTSFISCPGGSFNNVVDMSFSWPVSGGGVSSDADSGVLGWQYQINSTAGSWLGDGVNTKYGEPYIPIGNSTRTLTQAQDGSSIVVGNNVVYFRTLDRATTNSSDGTIRTCSISYGGDAPQFGGADTVTVTPATAESNSFALSWPAATPAGGRTIAKYYYMVDTVPPATLATLQGNPSTYIDNGTATTVSAGALPGVNKGANTVYVVAVDDANAYSPSNYITGAFTLNSTDPDNVGNLVASDSSIKTTSTWMVTLVWTAPVYQGAGNLAYYVYRSSNGTDFALVGATSGLSFVDIAPSSSPFYYKVVTRDGAGAESSGTNAVTITPTGRFTSPPTLVSGPTASNITTRKALVTWTTSRTSDTKVQYGLAPGKYFEVEPSISAQVAFHSIELPGLSPSTTYYYRTRWTDEDGNTGVSAEKSFTTQPPPAVTDVAVSAVGLDTALISFTVERAASVNILYGPTGGFGGVEATNTSLVKSRYSVHLSGLTDGTKYFFRVDPVDVDGESYSGTVLDFTTYPRPRILNVLFQELPAATATIEVTWESNTPLSSIVTFYPEDRSSPARDVVSLERVTEHKIEVVGLRPTTPYILVVRGVDAIGNEAVSDAHKFTTATDTRPPEITNVQIETSIRGLGADARAQVVISWETDEPATGQLKWDTGAGETYSRKTPEDTNLVFYHTQVLTDLNPSNVYHFRIVTKDKAANEAQSDDYVFITPERTDSALNLIIANLGAIFSFLQGLNFGGGR